MSDIVILLRVAVALLLAIAALAGLLFFRGLQQVIRELRSIHAAIPRTTVHTPAVAHDHAIISKHGHVVGHRPANHPDIHKALRDPELSVRYPDGTVKQGNQHFK